MVRYRSSKRNRVSRRKTKYKTKRRTRLRSTRVRRSRRLRSMVQRRRSRSSKRKPKRKIRQVGGVVATSTRAPLLARQRSRRMNNLTTISNSKAKCGNVINKLENICKQCQETANNLKRFQNSFDKVPLDMVDYKLMEELSALSGQCSSMANTQILKYGGVLSQPTEKTEFRCSRSKDCGTGAKCLKTKGQIYGTCRFK